MDVHAQGPTAFFLYRDSPLRREALRLEPGAGERYSLYGLDEIGAAGFRVEHNLEPSLEPGFLAQGAGRTLSRAIATAGGYGGNFGTVLACQSRLRNADVVFSTVDTVGIPLTLLARAGLVRKPIVYAAIGLPERLAQLRSAAMRELYRNAYRRLHTIVAYGAGEVDALRTWLGDDGPQVVFVPFGADTDYFRPEPFRPLGVDVVSIGADPRRDFGLLLEVARSRPEWSFLVVASNEYSQALAFVPANVRVARDVPLETVRDLLGSARVVALPVHDNTYSGATTVLLQAMASGKPVVVSRTAAIAAGYHLEAGDNCVLVPPGDAGALEHAVGDLLDHPEQAASMGARARETVERHLTWRHYTDAIREYLLAAARASTVRA